jgi:hypothetical protein
MVAVLYRCPNTGTRVQDHTGEQIPAGYERYEPVTCLACKQVHLVNLKTGEVLTHLAAEMPSRRRKR